MATQTPTKKIADFYSPFSNPAGAAPNPFASLVSGLFTPPPASAFQSTTAKFSPAPATPAPNMSTVNGPRYAPPPTLSSVAAGGPTVAKPVVAAQPTIPARTNPSAAPVGPQGATGAAPASQTPIPRQYLNADGSIKTPEQVAAEIAGTVKTAVGAPDVGRLALADINGPGNKSVADLRTEARRISNTRNDIAVGESDPYKVASQSGIAYTPAELSAIEKAYAGVYDPALDSALSKVEAKQKADEEAAAAKSKAEAERNAPFTLGKDQVRYDGQGNPIAVGISSDSGAAAGSYTPGANPTVDSFIKGIRSGVYKPSDIPEEYKALVAQGMAASQPAISQSSTEAVSVINQLLGRNLENISGFRITDPSSLFPGTDAQTTMNLAKQLNGMLSLDNRNQLKGSGAISDFEFRVLQQAASALGIDSNGRTNLSPEDFKAELEKMQLKLLVGETALTDDELLFLQGKGYTPEDIRALGQQSFNSVGNTTASTGKGNRPQRNNNPGNVKAGGLADSLAIGRDDQDHLIFPDAESGFKALSMDLTAKINGASRYLPKNPTIAQLGKVYAEDPNWPKKVAMMLGVGVNTATSSVPFDQLVKAIATQEGFYA